VKNVNKENKGEVPIYLRITLNGERAKISVDRSVNLLIWDKFPEKVAHQNPLKGFRCSSINQFPAGI
jgi:hypothetical protein